MPSVLSLAVTVVADAPTASAADGVTEQLDQLDEHVPCPSAGLCFSVE